MNKSEAYESMRQGNRITHRFFSDDEFIFILDRQMYTEEGYRFERGWEERTGGAWENDWSIYKPNDSYLDSQFSILCASIKNKKADEWLGILR